MLKISLPGEDSNAIPTLTADQVNSIPSNLLDDVFEAGRLADFGDLKILLVEKDQHMPPSNWWWNGFSTVKMLLVLLAGLSKTMHW